MKHKKSLIASFSGTVVVGLFCFTHILVVLLGAVGLSAFAGSLNHILFPVFVIMLAITAFSYYRYRRHCQSSTRR